MYLPKPFGSFSKKHPDILEQYQQLGRACREAGPLDEKAQNLVKLGIAVGANSRGGVMSGVRKSLEAGATVDEVHHAVLLAMTTIGFPGMIAAIEWADEVLDKQER